MNKKIIGYAVIITENNTVYYTDVLEGETDTEIVTSAVKTFGKTTTVTIKRNGETLINEGVK